MSEAEHITRALGGRWSGRSGIACCPAHEDTNPSLSISQGTSGRLLLTCHAGCSFVAIRDVLRGLGLTSGRAANLPHDPRLEAARKAEDRRQIQRREQQAQTLWRETLPLYGTVAEAYLRNRGIICDLPPTIRYLGNCWHPNAKRLPAMVGKVTGGDGFAVHRTYLRGDGAGKAAYTPAKAMLGPTWGGAVYLTPTRGRLVVTEGIETGLSLLSGLIDGPATICAALSAGGMKALNLPDQPGELLIAPDGDDVGRKAADALAHRAHALGWRVSLMPAPDGYDWNDVLTGKAVAS